MKSSFKLIIVLLYSLLFLAGAYEGYLNAESVKNVEQRVVYVYLSMPEQIQNISAQREITPATSIERPKITLATWQLNAMLFVIICGKTLFILPVLDWYYTQGYMSGMMISSLLAKGIPLTTFFICMALEMIVYTLGVVWTFELAYDFWYVKLYKNRDFKTDPTPIFHRYIKRIIAGLIVLIAAALVEDYLKIIVD